MPAVKEILDRKGRNVFTIGPQGAALDAACRMNEERIGSLVVVEGDRVVGIVTERDIMTRVVAVEREPSSTKVSEIMSSEIASCTPETQIAQCQGVMTGKRIRRLPVIVESKLIGIVTSGDVLRHQIERQRDEIGYLTEYLESPPPPRGA